MPRVEPRRAVAADKAPVNPLQSASIRTSSLPACPITPDPSPMTRNPVDHAVHFTCRVPSRRTT